MPKKSLNTEVATKQDLLDLEIRLDKKLDQKLEEKLEQKLEQKLEEKLEQKLGEKLSNYPTRAETKMMIDDAFDKWSFQLDEKLASWRNEFYNKIDPILAEIENDREDRAISTDEMHKIKNKLDDHEKRIITLETN